MKKFVLLLSIFILSFQAVACGGGKTDKTGYTFIAPDGAPALSIAKFIYDGQNFNQDADFNYSVVQSSDIGIKFINGDADFIVMPINSASKLNTENKYKMVSVLTHGNLYIVSKEELTLSSLKGEVVGVIGQGLVPDLTFKAILKNNNINYEVGDTAKENKVVLTYYKDATDMLPLLKQGKLSVGLIPEPMATKLSDLDEGYKYRLNVQELYNPQTSSYPQAVLMAKSGIVKDNPQLISEIEQKFGENIPWLKENIEEGISAVNSKLIGGATPSLTVANINQSVIDNCNIFWQKSQDAKQEVKNYLSEIIAIESTSAKAVGDDFFL